MVPHRQVLQIISLAALGSPERVDTRDTLCRDLNVNFPCTLDDYLTRDVFPWLTPDVEALIRTTDFKLMFDYRPLFAAAKQLGIDKFLCVTGEGPSYAFANDFVKWRGNRSLRVFIETALLCEISAEQIAEDIRHIYGITALPDDIKLFEQLFVDKLYAFGNNWLTYAFCIGDEEAKFKCSLVGEPKDYVRWRLGVPVALDSERVIHRLTSDAYFSLRLLKSKLDDPTITPTKDQLARLRFEHDVIYKGIDRLTKMAEVNKASGTNEGANAADAIRHIILEFKDFKHANKNDLDQGPVTIADLNK